MAAASSPTGQPQSLSKTSSVHRAPPLVVDLARAMEPYQNDPIAASIWSSQLLIRGVATIT
jgi:hypothetical protein